MADDDDDEIFVCCAVLTTFACVYLSRCEIKHSVWVKHYLRERQRYRVLTLSGPVVSKCYTSKCSGSYWSNPHF